MEKKMQLCMQCMMELDEEALSCPYCGFNSNSKQQSPYILMGTVLHEKYICGKMIRKNIDSAVYIGYDLSAGKTIELREFFPDKIAFRNSDGLTMDCVEEHSDIYGEYLQSYSQLWRNLMRFKGLPALFNVNEIFTANNTVYAVTDHNDSTTFRKILKNADIENNPMTLKKVKSLIVPMLSTIESLHTANVVHRGISPDTLVLSSDGTLKLTGFEIPQVRTTKNQLICSVCDGYAAIEQYGFSWQQGAWTDIYSIGALIYELLTGRIIKSAPERLNDDTVLFTDKEKQRIPESVINLVKDCLAVMPQDRIKSIAQIRDVFVPFDAPVSNVTRSVSHVRDLNSNVRVRTNETRIPVDGDEDVKIYTKPKQAVPQTKTSQPKVIVISEDKKIKERFDREKEKQEAEEKAKEKAKIEREQLALKLREIEKQKQEEKRQREEKIKNTPIIAASYKASKVVNRNPVILGTVVAVVVAILCMILTLTLYGTVLYKVFDAPVLDNCLASFSFLPVNQNKEEELKFYEVPDFSGLTKEAIENESAFSRKFNFVFEYDYCDTVASGYVFSQSINPGEQAQKGSTVTVYISKGIEMITVPEVMELTGTEAQEKLTQLGFNVTVEKQYNNGFHKEDKIISLSVTEGDSYPKGSDVVIKVWGQPVWLKDPDSETTTTDSNQNDTPNNDNNDNNSDRPFDLPSIFDWLFGDILG